ncbi:hypothetical protein [Saccharopolyspora sp. NPDC002686]|uniref:hypothetical protein n=1 Tax=Saccharopolyspora sp. NPDC002686 TaxID=3154541 RepID=UPI0033292CE2
MTEFMHEHVMHKGKRSSWDGRGFSLCGKTFAASTIWEPFFYGGVTCEDCKAAKKAGKTL